MGYALILVEKISRESRMSYKTFWKHNKENGV